MISYQQAKTFLDNILELPVNWENILEKNVLSFLKLYMKHHSSRIPFQNVTMAAVEKSKRVAPTIEDLITQGVSGVGGCCLNLNFFSKILFQALGLDSFVIRGNHDCAPVEGTHCMVIVRVDDENMYLVEVGGAFPILDPVPMQNLPFKILCAGGFPYEFRQLSDGWIGRYHIGGGLLGGKYVGKTEALRTSWDLTPREYSEFDYPMLETFTNPPNSVLLRGPMMYRYFFPEEVTKMLKEELFDDNNKNGVPKLTSASNIFIFAYKRLIVIGDEYARRLVKRYENYADMSLDISKYFPMLEPKQVDKACEAWSEFEVVPTPYDNIL